MLKNVLAAGAVLFSAVSANAATYRVDVTGSFSQGRIGFGNVIDVSGPEWVYLDPVSFTFEEFDAFFGETRLLDDVPRFETSGSAIFNGDTRGFGSFDDCSGLLAPLCGFWSFASLTALDLPSDEFSFLLAGVDSCCWGDLNELGFSYVDDGTRSASRDGIVYMQNGGAQFGYILTFDTAQISVIPLPAGMLLGLTSLATLAGLRLSRRRRG